MGETVEALGYKADVKTRAKENVQGKVDSVKDKITGATDAITGKASDAGSSVADATPDAQQMKHQARRAVGVAQENPLGLAVGAMAVGFLAGMLIPETRVEHEKLGPMADQVKDQVRQTGQEALERGKDVAHQAVESAKETAQEHAQEMKESAADSASETSRFARENVGS